MNTVLVDRQDRDLDKEHNVIQNHVGIIVSNK